MYPDEARRLADALRLMVAHEARVSTAQGASGSWWVWILWPSGPVGLATVGEVFGAMRQLLGAFPWALQEEG